MTATVEDMLGRRPDAANLSPASVMADESAPPRFATDPLLAAVLSGAPDAQDRLVAAYGPHVHGTISRYLALRCRGRLDLADDLTHEVFLALFRDGARRLRGYESRNGCSFAGWLRVVAVRLTIDVLRRDRRLVSLDDDSTAMTELRRTLQGGTADPELAFQGSETAGQLARAIAGLGPKDRLLVELHLLRGASLPAVATALGVSANAAYVRKSRVLDRLRRSVKDIA
jgi:RNA polymerase sigma factor (sigma-70 family)